MLSRLEERKNGYINEENLIKQFETLLDTIDLDETEIKRKIKDEVEQVQNFNRFVLGNREKTEIKDIDIRNYAKYILRNKSAEEKRNFLECLKGKISLLNGVLLMI